MVAATRVTAEEEKDRPASRDLVEGTARLVDEASAGLPVGVQVAARSGREDPVLAVMATLEAGFRERSDYPLRPLTPPTSD